MPVVDLDDVAMLACVEMISSRLREANMRRSEEMLICAWERAVGGRSSP